MVNAMSTMRCLARIPGISTAVPMHVQENGWPTAPNRPPAMQARVANELVRAVHDFRGTYNVSDYRWFNLRDADSSDPRFAQQYGLLRDDYSDKPAFGVYCRLVAALSLQNPSENPGVLPARCGSGGSGGGGSGSGGEIVGTAGDDELGGTAGDDTIRCGAGNDRVDAGGGDDLVLCGSGDDVVAGRGGDDRLYGESGDDRLDGGPGDDRLEGGSGRDQLSRP